MLDAQEDELEEKEAAIHTLEEEIQENEELLSEVDGPGEVTIGGLGLGKFMTFECGDRGGGVRIYLKKIPATS